MQGLLNVFCRYDGVYGCRVCSACLKEDETPHCVGGGGPCSPFDNHEMDVEPLWCAKLRALIEQKLVPISDRDWNLATQ